ncbi:MAG: polysaccharide deacetylase family protein [Candidatus Obscuribacterales bacterium]|nr:polysaccharide deacetylase family protein [Candidatus Obscuribacterales bacterium]
MKIKSACHFILPAFLLLNTAALAQNMDTAGTGGQASLTTVTPAAKIDNGQTQIAALPLSTYPPASAAMPTKSALLQSSKKNRKPSKVADNNKTKKLAPKVLSKQNEDPLLISARIISSAKPESNDPQDKWVALTFDDGPSPVYTPQILAILRENGIHATFCVVGRQIKKYPELVKQIVAEGHKVANHSMNHDEFLYKKAKKKIKQEVLCENALLAEIIPQTPIEYYRTPAGNWNLSLRKMVAAWGMKPLGWSIDSKDWQRPGVEKIVSNVENHLHNGAVILMHDGGGDRSESVEALKKIICKLKTESYKFAFPK